MKRRIAALLALTLVFCCAAGAEGVMNELRNMRKSAGDRILEMEPVITPAPVVTPEPTPTPDVTYEPLSQGMKGDGVKDVQQRLISLGYLTGGADGSYGGRTVAAVKAFQQAAGLEPTGEADDATQKALFWTPAPEARSYEKLDYGRALNEADAYRDTAVTFSGTALQVLEDDTYADSLGVYTALRVATRGGFDDVAYVALFRAKDAPPIAEGDKVTVRGIANGLYVYTNDAGTDIALPRIEADGVE